MEPWKGNGDLETYMIIMKGQEDIKGLVTYKVGMEVELTFGISSGVDRVQEDNFPQVIQNFMPERDEGTTDLSVVRGGGGFTVWNLQDWEMDEFQKLMEMLYEQNTTLTSENPWRLGGKK